MISKMDRLKASVGDIILIHDEIYWFGKSGISGMGSWDGKSERVALLIDIAHRDDCDESTVEGYSFQHSTMDSFFLVILLDDVIRRVIIIEDSISLQDGDSFSRLNSLYVTEQRMIQDLKGHIGSLLYINGPIYWSVVSGHHCAGKWDMRETKLATLLGVENGICDERGESLWAAIAEMDAGGCEERVTIVVLLDGKPYTLRASCDHISLVK